MTEAARGRFKPYPSYKDSGAEHVLVLAALAGVADEVGDAQRKLTISPWCKAWTG